MTDLTKAQKEAAKMARYLEALADVFDAVIERDPERPSVEVCTDDCNELRAIAHHIRSAA